MKNLIKNLLKIEKVYAHCDIPCSIYDAYPMQIAAHTVLRMVHLIQQLDKNDPEYHHKLARYTAVKEEHAELCKHEVRVLWGDYFKPEHVEQFPELQQLVWDILKQASAARQRVDEEAAKKLIELVHKLAEIFWKTKGLKPKKVPAPYPTGEDIVIFE